MRRARRKGAEVRYLPKPGTVVVCSRVGFGLAIVVAWDEMDPVSCVVIEHIATGARESLHSDWIRPATYQELVDAETAAETRGDSLGAWQLQRLRLEGAS